VVVDRARLLRGRSDSAIRRRPLPSSSSGRQSLALFVQLVATILVVGLASAAVGVGLAHVVALATIPLPPPDPECGTHWIVRAGDTLWHVARTCYPHVDRRMAVDAIQRANPGLDPGRLQVGQRIVLPVGGGQHD